MIFGNYPLVKLLSYMNEWSGTSNSVFNTFFRKFPRTAVLRCRIPN